MNGGPEPYPLAMEIVNSDATNTEQMCGWYVLPSDSIHIPPSPGSSNIQIGWSSSNGK
jgi:hypothetical protein